MGYGKKRNELCWCNSGLKYKSCHLKKETQQEIQSYEIHNNFKNSLKFKTCKVPQELKNECSISIVHAHTISKSSNLKHICSSDGKVYAMNIDMLSIKEQSNPISLTLQHINQVSAFYIFCQTHDKKLFAPLEDKKFIFSNEQIFLLAYRIIAKAVYLKEQQIELQKLSKDYDRGITSQFQKEYLQFISHSFSDKYSQLNDISFIKNKFDKDLLKKDFDSIKFYCLIFDKIPEVMSAGAFIPDINFEGKILIDYVNNYNKEYNAILTSIIKINDNQGAIIFSWNNNIESSECENFIDSLNNLNNKDKIKAITCWLFKRNNENICLSPTWYENLVDEKKELIQTCYIHNKHLDYQDEDIEELLKQDISLIPDFFKNLDKRTQKEILQNLPIADDDISAFDKFDLFDWNIIEIKTNLEL
ncbi:MAG: SEC-C domain-containing protein [Aliarcobacter sp.]|nr:SEC-C domain-containing protein [Aliarcobacter sp.]